MACSIPLPGADAAAWVQGTRLVWCSSDHDGPMALGRGSSDSEGDGLLCKHGWDRELRSDPEPGAQGPPVEP